MSMHKTDTSGIDPAFLAMYRQDTLFTAEPALLFMNFGVKGRIVAGGEQGQGPTVKWRKMGQLPTVTSALSEGVNPLSNDISLTSVSATAEQIGAFVEYSDRVEKYSYDQFMGDTAKAQGYQAGRSMDYQTREVLLAGTSVSYPAGRVARSEIQSGDIITETQVKKAVRDLRNNDAMPFEGGLYVGVLGPSTEYDLLNTTEWKTLVQNNQSPTLLNRFEGHYIGAAWGVQWFRTTQSRVYEDAGNGGAVDVHVTMLFGMNAYGVLAPSGEGDDNNPGLQYIINPVGSAGAADPLHLKGTSGWKVDKADKILFDSYMMRLEHAVSS